MKILKGALVYSVLILFFSTKIVSQELYVENNAASITGESNSIAGWNTVGTTLITSDANNSYHGSYALKAVSTSAADNDRNIRYTFDATIGEVYNISIWAKPGSQSVDPAFAAWSGVSGFVNPSSITSTEWAEYTFTVTATAASITLRIYTGSSGAGAVGDILYVDSISIKTVNSENGSTWVQNGSNVSFTEGNVGIGIADPGTWKLAVNGNIRAKEIKVETDWADYVFEKNYVLPSLDEVANHIKKNGHLINIPSAKEVEENGVELGEMNKLLLEKIEELTLYILNQENRIRILENQQEEN
jgi:hypothetical protein